MGHKNLPKAKEEEAEEAPIKGKVIKIKAKTPPTSQLKTKKATMPTHKKPKTRAIIRASTQKANKEAIKKKRTTKKA